MRSRGDRTRRTSRGRSSSPGGRSPSFDSGVSGRIGPGAQTGRGRAASSAASSATPAGVGRGDELERAVRGGLVHLPAAFGDHRSRPAGVLADDPLLHRATAPRRAPGWAPAWPAWRPGAGLRDGFAGDPGADGAPVPRRRWTRSPAPALGQSPHVYAKPGDGESRRRPVAGFDATFTVPKSVSVLWALADTPTREVIYACHRQAIADVLSGHRTRRRPHPDRHQRRRPGRHPRGDRGRVRPLGLPRPRPEPAHPRRASPTASKARTASGAPWTPGRSTGPRSPCPNGTTRCWPTT